MIELTDCSDGGGCQIPNSIGHVQGVCLWVCARTQIAPAPPPTMTERNLSKDTHETFSIPRPQHHHMNTPTNSIVSFISKYKCTKYGSAIMPEQEIIINNNNNNNNGPRNFFVSFHVPPGKLIDFPSIHKKFIQAYFDINPNTKFIPTSTSMINNKSSKKEEEEEASSMQRQEHHESAIFKPEDLPSNNHDHQQFFHRQVFRHKTTQSYVVNVHHMTLPNNDDNEPLEAEEIHNKVECSFITSFNIQMDLSDENNTNTNNNTNDNKKSPHNLMIPIHRQFIKEFFKHHPNACFIATTSKLHNKKNKKKVQKSISLKSLEKNFPQTEKDHNQFFHYEIVTHKKKKKKRAPLPHNTTSFYIIKIYHTVLMKKPKKKTKEEDEDSSIPIIMTYKLKRFLQRNHIWISCNDDDDDNDDDEIVNVVWLHGAHPLMVNRKLLEKYINTELANLPSLATLASRDFNKQQTKLPRIYVRTRMIHAGGGGDGVIRPPSSSSSSSSSARTTRVSTNAIVLACAKPKLMRDLICTIKSPNIPYPFIPIGFPSPINLNSSQYKDLIISNNDYQNHVQGITMLGLSPSILNGNLPVLPEDENDLPDTTTSTVRDWFQMHDAILSIQPTYQSVTKGRWIFIVRRNGYPEAYEFLQDFCSRIFSRFVSPENTVQVEEYLSQMGSFLYIKDVPIGGAARTKSHHRYEIVKDEDWNPIQLNDLHLIEPSSPTPREAAAAASQCDSSASTVRR